jgi:PHD/YefM family antitoxin component YafN of YafNO toxin-antitoxin module
MEDWSAIEETLFLTSIPGMRESIMAGLKTPLHKTSKGIKW